VLDATGNLYGVSSVWQTKLVPGVDGGSYYIKVPASQDFISLDRNGNRRFKTALGGLATSGLQVGPDGQVLVGLSDGRLLRYPAGGSGAPATLFPDQGATLLAALDGGEAIVGLTIPIPGYQQDYLPPGYSIPRIVNALARLDSGGHIRWQTDVLIYGQQPYFVDASKRLYYVTAPLPGGTAYRLVALDVDGQEVLSYDLPPGSQGLSTLTPDALGGVLIPWDGLLRLAD
jgi:hypothetical protein